MTNHTTYLLMTILASVGALAMSPAFAAQQACPDCEGAMITNLDDRLEGVPVVLWTDSPTYNHNSMIKVTGQVNNLKGQPVTITVLSPLNNIITIQQVDVGTDKKFSTTISTAGNLWKYDGTYVIRATYGAQEVNDKVLVQLTGGDSITIPACDGPDEYMENGVCVPEFGTVAIMILAVAIISIIAVSARSRLNILPKY